MSFASLSDVNVSTEGWQINGENVLGKSDLVPKNYTTRNKKADNGRR